MAVVIVERANLTPATTATKTLAAMAKPPRWGWNRVMAHRLIATLVSLIPLLAL